MPAVYKRQLLAIKLRDIWCFIGTGVLSIVFFNYCYFRAMTLIPLSIAAILLYTAPAFVLFMSAVLFKEKITKRKVIVLIVTILGCAFAAGITGSTGPVSFIGIVYGIGAGIGYALYSIFGRYAINKGYGSMTISFYTFLCAAVAAVPFANIGKITCIGVRREDDLVLHNICNNEYSASVYSVYKRTFRDGEQYGFCYSIY